jgi:AAA15 family ATPase/GTPase
MRYTKFAIKNFKGISEINLDLDKEPKPPVYAFVGLNESGKTSILEAMHWLYSPNTYNPYDLIPKNQLANFTGEISVEANIRLSKEDQKAIDKLFGSGRNKIILEYPLDTVKLKRTSIYKNSVQEKESLDWEINLRGKRGNMKKSKDYSEEDSVWINVRDLIDKKLKPPIIYYENFLFDFPEKIYLQAKPEKALSKQNGVYRQIIQDVLNSIDPRWNIEDQIVSRYLSTSPFKGSLEAVLLRVSSNITQEVFGIWRELLKIEDTSGVEITLGNSLKEDDTGYYLEVNVREGDQLFKIRERSLGFRWFFAFILFTHFRAFRFGKDRKSLFLLDEPASNLHPSAQTKLLNFFENFPHQQQVIYATHSHHMINTKWLSGTYVVKNNAIDYSHLNIGYHANQTTISATRYFQFVAEYPEDVDFYRPILDALDYQLSSLELVPEMIITEGKNDFYTLKYMAEGLDVGNEVGKYVYPGTGKDKTERAVKLYLGWGRNFLVLLDDDKGGIQTKDRLKKELGPILENRVFTMRDVNKDWRGMEMEDLFMESDQMKVILSVFPDEKKYDKSKFNAALQSHYVNRTQIKLHAYTEKKFHKLFAFIEEKLAENR